jgi:transposase
MPNDQPIREATYPLRALEGWTERRHSEQRMQVERELKEGSACRWTSVPSCLAAFAGSGAPRIHPTSNDEG